MTTSYSYQYDNELLSKDLNKYLGFLVEKFGYLKLPEYKYVREIHNDFVGKEIVIKLNYEGSFMLEVLKPNFKIENLLNGKKKTVDFEYSSFKRYNLRNLDLNKDIYNSISGDNYSNKDLWYFSKLLQENPDILEGDLTKLKWPYRFLKRLGLK